MPRRYKWLNFTIKPLGAACAFALAVWGCGAKANRDTLQIEGNTNWLRFCEADADCGAPLRCLCNTCTAACGTVADCDALGAVDLQCVAASGVPARCAELPASVCSFGCRSDADCTGELQCAAGVCLALRSPPEGVPTPMPMPAPGAQDAGTGSTPAPPVPMPAFEPAERCLAPYSAEGCTIIRQYYFYEAEKGECSPSEACVDLGREGNAFFTLEECRAVCEGRPSQLPCPEGTIARTICLGCGVTGGCSPLAEVCATPCTESAECTGLGALGGCYDGVCEVGGCL